MKTLIRPFQVLLFLALILSCGNTSVNKNKMTCQENDNMLRFKLTDNPNYNPNVESNLTWKPIEHK